MENHPETATLAAGCFWCYEPIFKSLRGVISVTAGYAGGDEAAPTYEQVSSKATGHAEAFQIKFDPTIISFHELLEVFWRVHDPTTLNRQGHDVGPQYRSEVFYHNDEQREIAEKFKQELDESGEFEDPIVTLIGPFKSFYVAEDYHQDYYTKNSDQPYCNVVIKPKLDKFRHLFADKLKQEAA